MKLTMDLITDCLANTYNVKQFGSAENTLCYSRPRLYSSGTTFSKEGLYFARVEAFPRKLPKNNIGIICVGMRIPQEWISLGIHILQITDAQSTLDLFNEIYEIFDTFDSWESQLRDELERDIDFDIRKVLEIGTKMIGNPIGVADHGLQAILRTEITATLSDRIEVKVIDITQPIEIEHYERVKEVCRLERKITTPYISTIELEKQQFYCFNLYPADHFVGCVSIGEQNHPFRSGDFPLMDYFFFIFEKAFLKYLRNFGNTETLGLSALHNLLDNVPLGIAEQEQLSLQQNECWRCFKLKPKQETKYMPKDYMYTTLSAMLPRTVYAVIHQEEIVGLIRIPQNDPQKEESLLEVFSDIVDRMGYIGGMSNPFTELEKIAEFLLQATYAADQNICSRAASTLCFFHNLVFQYMLYSCTGELPQVSIYPQGLKIIADYDRRKGTEYVKTLKTYLMNEMNISKTSAALYIHRSSFIKRFNKIKQLVTEDLDDSNVRLHYRLCFALMDSNSR